MLVLNNIIMLFSVISGYILTVFVELIHFFSEINSIIFWESFFCLTIIYHFSLPSVDFIYNMKFSKLIVKYNFIKEFVYEFYLSLMNYYSLNLKFLSYNFWMVWKNISSIKSFYFIGILSALVSLKKNCEIFLKLECGSSILVLA